MIFKNFGNFEAVGSLFMIRGGGVGGGGVKLSKNAGYHGWPTTRNFKTTLAKMQ